MQPRRGRCVSRSVPGRTNDMETAMRLLPLIAILAFVAAASTQAGQERQHLAAPTPGAPDGSLNVGQGVICDTLEQARRLVSLQNDGRAINEALGAVNQDA